MSEQNTTQMVDVSHKDIVLREAEARGEIQVSSEALALIENNQIPKGNVLEVARVAAILAAKNTPQIIPLCHPIKIDNVKVEFSFQQDPAAVSIRAFVRGRDRTGVEMEALSAVSVAALTIYDMCKIVDKAMVISQIRLLKKTKAAAKL